MQTLFTVEDKSPLDKSPTLIPPLTQSISLVHFHFADGERERTAARDDHVTTQDGILAEYRLDLAVRELRGLVVTLRERIGAEIGAVERTGHQHSEQTEAGFWGQVVQYVIQCSTFLSRNFRKFTFKNFKTLRAH